MLKFLPATREASPMPGMLNHHFYHSHMSKILHFFIVNGKTKFSEA